jgi:hypothetical protein
VYCGEWNSYEPGVTICLNEDLIEMTLNWTNYEGHLAGAWRLDSFLGFRDGKASYKSSDESGESAEVAKGLVQIVVADDEGSGAVRRSWEHASKCSGDHLLRVYDTGETELDGTPVVYAAMEEPDADVEEILAGRALVPEEARTLVAGAASALDYLHKRGLQHGAVTPLQMHVVGNEVKLSVHTIAAADDAGWESDMRQLGTTLIQALTDPADGEEGRPLPHPFRAIASGCLGAAGRPWTAHRVLQTISGSAMISGSAVADPDRIAAAPAVRPLPSEPDRKRWIIVTAAVVLLGVVGYWLVTEPKKPAAVAQAPAPVAAPASAAVVPVRPPAVETTRARTVAPPLERTGTSTGSQSNWAVIAATYANREAAEKRAAQIVKRSPRLHAHVFTPAGGARKSYIVLGSGLTKQEAERLRGTARQAGAPGDSYVTKLTGK